MCGVYIKFIVNAQRKKKKRKKSNGDIIKYDWIFSSPFFLLQNGLAHYAGFPNLY